MAGAFRWRAAILLFVLVTLVGATPAIAGQPDGALADAQRQLEIGKRQMGQNNPAYADDPEDLTLEARALAGQLARATFRKLTEQYQDFPEGWLWLGVSLTETLTYSREHPDGEFRPHDADITEGLNAFAEAYKRRPNEYLFVVYYGEALISYRQEFDQARIVWDNYLKVADTDMQRMMALVQAGRACLNKAYFGKRRDKMPAAEVKQHYLQAVDYTARAAKLCPKAQDVRDMQQLLESLRKELLGA